MPIAGTVELLTQAGLDAPSVRTAVHRLKGNGWLASEARDGARGYALTTAALDTLAAGDEVIWHARTPADLADGWCIVHFGVPETMRAKRQQLRAHLSSLGFGNVGTALWIAPARMRAAAERAVAELGPRGPHRHLRRRVPRTQDLTGLLYGSWDLAAIDEAYREFVATYEPVVAAAERRQPDQASAFVTYLQALDQWRKLPYKDPGLPAEVLASNWHGPQATAVFERLVSALERPALVHARTHWPALGTTLGVIVIVRVMNV